MNQINNAIGYQGTVSAKLKNSVPVHFHNAGHKALWDSLAMAIAGYDISNRRPRYFMVLSKTLGSEGFYYEDCLISKVPFVGAIWGNPVEVSDDSTSVRFTATVTYKDRRKTIDTSRNSVAVLRMYDVNGNLLAEVEDNINNDIASIHNSMITGVDAIYEWKMTFKNVSVNSN